MLRHASTQARQALILDFLAPSIIRPYFRPNSTVTRTQPQTKQPPARKTPTFPLQGSSPSSLLAKLRTNIDDDENKTSVLSAEKIDRYNEIIADIRWTLDARRRPEQLLKLWKQLDELRVVHTLGHAQLVPLSALMIDTFLGDPSKTVKNRHKEVRKGSEGKGQILDEDGRIGMIGLEPSLKMMVQNIALLAARNDSWDAIVTLMRYDIKERDTEAVLSLYDKFMSLVGDKNLEMDQELQREGGVGNEEVEGVGGTKNLLVTDSELMSRRPLPISVGRVHLLTAVAAAHIMNGSFKKALDACLTTVVQLDEKQAEAFIDQALDHDSSLRTKVNRYLQQIIVACLISRPAVFVQHVTSLGARRSGESLEKLYSVVKNGLRGKEAFLAADPSLVTESKTIALTTIGWNALLSAFLKCEKKDTAGQLWDDMTTFGVPPGISMWTALIDAYGQICAADDATATWNMMKWQGMEPDTLAYRAIISALFKGRRPRDAMVMFEAYRALPVDEGPRRLSLYNSVLHGLCASFHSEAEALKLREIMEKEGPKPDLITYNIFINFYGRRQKFRGIAATLRAMQLAGLDGDVFTYTTILSALLKAGKRDGAELVLALMDKQGVKKNAALYTSLINDQLRQGGESNFQAAMRMLASMEKDPQNPPTEITYTSILRALYRLSWMDPDELQRTEANILQRMRHRKVSLGLPAYNHLLKACFVYPYGNGVQQAMAYYEEMKRREIPIVNTTWYILLAGLMNKGEWGIASKLVEELYASGIHPRGPLLGLVHQVNNRTSW